MSSSSFDLSTGTAPTSVSQGQAELGYDGIDPDLREWTSDGDLRVRFEGADGRVSNYTGDELEVGSSAPKARCSWPTGSRSTAPTGP